MLRNEGPLISELLLPPHQLKLLTQRPLVPPDVWAQEVDPPLSALLPLPSRTPKVLVDDLSDILPLFLSMLFNEVLQDFVLFGSPGLLLRRLLVFGLPFVMALVVVPARYELGYVLPVLHGLKASYENLSSLTS